MKKLRWPLSILLTRTLAKLKIAPLPCWLAVPREIHSNRVVRRVYDFLAAEIPAELVR